MKQEKGYFEEMFNRGHDVVLTIWVDNRIVNMAFNFIGVGVSYKVNIWDKTSKKYFEISRPEVIRRYNASMGGVDKMDFFIKIY